MSPINVLQLVLQVLCNCKRVAVLVAAADAWSSEDCRLAVCSVWHELVEASQNAKSDPKLKQNNATVALSAANTENSHSTAAAAVATINTPPVSWASDVVAVQTGTHEVWRSASCSFATQYVLLDIVAVSFAHSSFQWVMPACFARIQVVKHLCFIAAGLPPEDPRARDHFKPFSSRDAHVLKQLRFSFHAASTAPAQGADSVDHLNTGGEALVAKTTMKADRSATAEHVASATTLRELNPAPIVPCRGRLSAVLRHVLEVCTHQLLMLRKKVIFLLGKYLTHLRLFSE